MGKSANKTNRAKVEDILRKESANLIKKVSDGGSLTAPQRAALLGFLDGEAIDLKAYAKNKSELADVCGVTRQTIHNYMRHKDAPKPLDNGNHDVVAWKMYLAKKGVTDDPSVMPDKSVYESYLLHLKCSMMAIQVAKAKGEVIDKTQHRGILLRVAQACDRAIKSIPGRVSAINRDPQVFSAVKKICENASQSIRQELGL